MRKKVVGRSRGGSSLNITLERANKKLKALRKTNRLGHYASKELFRAFSSDNKVKVDRSAGDIIKINTKNLSIAEQRYYKKVLDSFIRNKSSSPLGIADIEKRSRTTLKDTLSQITDKDITDSDIEDFYDLVENDEYRYFADKVGDSLMYILINEARDKNLSEDSFISMLTQYMTINSEEAREKAKKLYNKWVA